MKTEHTTFTVETAMDEPGLAIVREALTRLNGVVDVMVDVDLKRVAVEFDAERMEPSTLRGTIEDAGYKVR